VRSRSPTGPSRPSAGSTRLSPTWRAGSPSSWPPTHRATAPRMGRWAGRAGASCKRRSCRTGPPHGATRSRGHSCCPPEGTPSAWLRHRRAGSRTWSPTAAASRDSARRCAGCPSTASASWRWRTGRTRDPGAWRPTPWRHLRRPARSSRACRSRPPPSSRPRRRSTGSSTRGTTRRWEARRRTTSSSTVRSTRGGRTLRASARRTAPVGRRAPGRSSRPRTRSAARGPSPATAATSASP